MLSVDLNALPPSWWSSVIGIRWSDTELVLMWSVNSILSVVIGVRGDVLIVGSFV